MEPTRPQKVDIVEQARLDFIRKFSNHLDSEVALARHGGGFFDRKYWDNFIATKIEYQKESNKFYTILHELAK